MTADPIVEDRLWISNIDYVRNNETSDFDRIVSVCQDSTEANVGCAYDHYKLSDGIPQGYNRGECSYEVFHDAVDVVVNTMRSGSKVLVHCHAGRSRSAAVCIAALAVYEDIPYMEAYDRVADSRRIDIQPNHVLLGFAKQYVKDADSGELIFG